MAEGLSSSGLRQGLFTAIGKHPTVEGEMPLRG
jgi:hypothetical protein